MGMKMSLWKMIKRGVEYDSKGRASSSRRLWRLASWKKGSLSRASTS
jgi:hypothetical protein